MVLITFLCLVSGGNIPHSNIDVENLNPSASIGELKRFKGFWIVNGDRRSRRAVFQTGTNTILTTTSEYRENFGCSYTRFRTIQMKYLPATKSYQARIKWAGKSMDSHQQAEWLETEFSGIWNSKDKSITWTGSHGDRTIKIITRFVNENKHTISVYEMQGDQVLLKRAESTFHRLH